MKGIKRRLLAGLSALAIAATTGVPAVFAEGSKDIGKAPETVNVQDGYSGDAYRPYAEWRNRPQLGDAVLDGSGNVKKDANGNEVFENMVQSKSVFYAYAKKGEKVYFGQSGHTATDRSIAAVATDKEPTAAELAKVANGGFSGSTIAVTMPVDKKTAYDPSKDGAGVSYAQGSEISGATYGDKRVFLFKPENKKGIITNAVQEQTGPKYGEDADRNLYGYDPFSFVAPEDGTYAFRFLSLDFVGDEKFDPFATPTPVPTAAPSAEPTAVPTPTPTPVQLNITALPAGTVVVFDTATGEGVGDTIDSTEKYAIITAVKDNGTVASVGWSGEAFGQECHKAASFGGAAFTVAVRPAVAGKLYIVATSSKDITIEARQGSNVSTGNITANTETIISFDVAANEDVYIKSRANGWTLGGMYLSTDGTYPTPTPTSEPTEEPIATPEPTAAPATYTVTAGTAANGSISVSPSTAAEGASIAITDTPASGYLLSALSYTPENGAAVALTTHSFTMPAANVTVDPTFTQIPTPTAIPAGTYTFISEERENNTTVGTTPRLAHNNYISEKGAIDHDLWITNAYAASSDIYDGTSDSALYMNRTGNDTAGGFTIIPAVSGTLSIAYAGGLADRQVTIKQGSSSVTSEGETPEVGANLTAKTLSMNVTAGQPVEIYGGGIYVYGLKLDAATYAVRIAGDITKAETIGADKYTAAEGETVTVTAVPKSGYVLTSLKINGAEYISSVQNGQLSFQMPASEAQVSVTFGEVSTPAPTAEPAYAEWVLSDNSSSVVKSGVANNPTLSLGTLSNNKDGTISYDTFHSGTKSYSSGTKFYYFKLGNGTQVTVTPDLANTSYEGYNLKIVYSNVKNANAVSVKATYTNSGEGATTVTGEDTSTTTYDVKTLNLTGLNADTVTIERNIVNEPELLYVGIEYYGGTASVGTSSVSGTAQTASLSEADSVSYVNENINGVTVSGLAQVVMGGTTFSAMPKAAALIGSASLMGTVNKEIDYIGSSTKAETYDTGYTFNNGSWSAAVGTSLGNAGGIGVLDGTFDADSVYVSGNGLGVRNRGGSTYTATYTLDNAVTNGTVTFDTGVSTTQSGNYRGGSIALLDGSGNEVVKVAYPNGNRAITATVNGSDATSANTYTRQAPRDSHIEASIDLDYKTATVTVTYYGQSAGRYTTLTKTGSLADGTNIAALAISTTAASKENDTTFIDNTKFYANTEVDADSYDLTVDSNITGGSIAISGGATTAEEGSTVSVTATPDTGYAFDHLVVNGVDQAQGVTSFTMPSQNTTVSAVFTAVQAAAGAVTVNYVDGSGTVLDSNTPSIDGMSVGDTLTYYYPAYVEYNGAYYKASTADSGVFGNTVTLTSSAQPVDVTYVADSTVVGFAEAENMNVSSGNGLVTDSGTQYSMGSARHFFVKGSRDIFAGFSIAEDGSYEFFGPVAPANNNYRMANASLDGVQGVTKTIDGAQTLSLTAYLTAGTYTFRFNNPNYGTQILDYVAVRKLDSSYTVSADQNLTNGSISVSAEQAAEGQNITITAAPASGYELDHIAVNGVDQPQGATSFTMPAANVTVSATFTEIPETSITLNAGDGGAVAITSGTTTSALTGLPLGTAGETVSGTYTPDQYFKLASLTVSTISGDNVDVTVGNGTFSFTMPENKVIITVTFEDTRLALTPIPSLRDTHGVVTSTTATVNGYDSSKTLEESEIVDSENGYIGVYSNAGRVALGGSGTNITFGASSDINNLDGLVEVIPDNYGVLIFKYQPSNAAFEEGTTVRMAQTSDFTAQSIINNTIAAAKHTASDENKEYELKAVVVPGEPVYFYTDTRYVRINSVTMTRSNDRADQEWRLNDESAPLVGAWDITVVGTDGNAKPGRVWTDILFLNAKAHGRSIYPKMNVLTEDSYEYEVDFNGLQPYSFLFYSNNRGFLQNKVGVDGTRVITPLLHSFYSYGEDGGMGQLPTHLEKSGFTSTVIGNYTPYEEGIDHTNKLFLNEVCTDSMQAYNNQSSREIDKGATMSYIVPKYVGYGGNADNEQYSMTAITNGDRDENNDRIVDVNKGTMGLGGKFMFTINEQAGAQRPADNTGDTVTLSPEEINSYIGKSFSLRLDFSGFRLDENNAPVLNPEVDYKDPVTGELIKVQEWQSNGGNPSEKERNNKVLLSTLIKGAGTYTLIWDGRDAYGNEVPVTVGTFAGGSVNSYPVQRFTESGIVHLPMVDVERLPWGIKVHRLTTPTPGSGAASTSENEDDTWDLYYNNDGISPSFNNAGAIQSSLINGTFTNSDGKSEINQEVYDFTPDSSWYYTGRSKFPYPSQIGDGVNQSAGISTADGGKMNVLAYASKDKYNATTYDSSNKATYRTSTVAKEKYNYISSNEQSYGDRAGLDMWASALSAPVMMYVGVNPNTFTTYSPAIVSFVAEEGTTSVAAPLDQSHVATSDGTRVNYPHHVGRPSTGEYNAAVDANKADALTTFGNTISTAFLSELTSGPTYHAVAGETDAQRYDIDGILWTITIPQQDIEKNYVKLGDRSYAQGWEGLNGASVMEDKASFTISNKPVTFDDAHRINKGTIYSMKKDINGDLQMKLKFRIPEFSVGEGLQRKVSIGLVLDNIYAPNASAIATYVDADNAKVDPSTGAKTSEIWEQQANFYKTQSGYTEMNSNVEYTDEAGIGYTYEAGKGYVKNGDTSILPNVIPGIVVTMKDMGYVEGRTFDDETKDNNAFFNHRFNTYTGGVYNGNVYTVNDEEAQLFSDEFVVDFWDVVESAESIGDIVGEQSEVNDGSANEIDMEDLSNGFETIDDILGSN